MPEKYSIFTAHLRGDEYIIWEGQTVSGVNLFHPIPYLIMMWNIVMVLWDAIYFVLDYVLPFAIVILSIGLIGTTAMFGNTTDDVIVGITFYLALSLFYVAKQIFDNRSSRREKINQQKDPGFKKNTRHKDTQEKRRRINPRTKNTYAITNQRVLIFADGRFKDVSLILLQDAAKNKPQNGTSDIHLYNSRSATGELPPPIATLHDLSEEDADTAYDLLIHARDISYEERIENLGLE